MVQEPRPSVWCASCSPPRNRPNRGLEQFIARAAERQPFAAARRLQCLQQIRGTLNLIELAGAELLAQEALQLATDIPTGVSEERDGQLAALGNASRCAATWRMSRPIARRSPSCSCRRSTKCAVGSRRCRKASSAPAWISAAAEHRHRPPAFRSRTGRKPADAPHVPDRPARPDPRTEPLSQPQTMGRALARSTACTAGGPFAAVLDRRRGDRVDRRWPTVASRASNCSRASTASSQLLIGPAYEAPRHLLKELLYLVALSDGLPAFARGPRTAYWRRCRSPTTCWKRNRSACPAPASR